MSARQGSEGVLLERARAGRQGVLSRCYARGVVILDTNTSEYAVVPIPRQFRRDKGSKDPAEVVLARLLRVSGLVKA